MTSGAKRGAALILVSMTTLIAGCGVVPMGNEPLMSLGVYADRDVSGPVADGAVFQRINGESLVTVPLRIMSANIRVRTMFDGLNNWPHRRDTMIETIRRFDPDILGTQESLWSQTKDLRKAFTEFEYVGAGRNDGKTSGEMCGVFFRRDRFTLLDQGTFWLSSTPDKPGSKSWGQWFPRMVAWVKLRDRQATDREFYFFNTHFSHADKGARLKSARLLRERIGQISDGAPVIVGGDFNDYETEPVYDVMCEGVPGGGDRPFTDTFRQAWPERTSDEKTHHSFLGGTKGLRIDWILISPEFDTLAATIDRSSVNGHLPSDHYPVNAVIRWSPEEMVVTAE